jgi:hypothetical protein
MKSLGEERIQEMLVTTQFKFETCEAAVGWACGYDGGGGQECLQTFDCETSVKFYLEE